MLTSFVFRLLYNGSSTCWIWEFLAFVGRFDPLLPCRLKLGQCRQFGLFLCLVMLVMVLVRLKMLLAATISLVEVFLSLSVESLIILILL